MSTMDTFLNEQAIYAYREPIPLYEYKMEMEEEHIIDEMCRLDTCINSCPPAKQLFALNTKPNKHFNRVIELANKEFGEPFVLFLEQDESETTQSEDDTTDSSLGEISEYNFEPVPLSFQLENLKQDIIINNVIPPWLSNKEGNVINYDYYSRDMAYFCMMSILNNKS